MNTVPRDTADKRHGVVVIDDHPVIRLALSQLFDRQHDLYLAAEAADATAGLRAIHATKPAVVVVDITLPGTDGLELTRVIRSNDDAPHVVIYSMHPDLVYAERALRCGATGYVMKDEPTDMLLKAVRQAVQGYIYLGENVSAKLLRSFARGSRTVSGVDPVESLSDREFEIFSRIGRGQGTSQIAAELHISPRTVESHRARIKEKLDVETASELLRHALLFNEHVRSA